MPATKAPKLNYAKDIKAEALKPVSQRKAICFGRGVDRSGKPIKVIPRNYAFEPSVLGAKRRQLADFQNGVKLTNEDGTPTNRNTPYPEVYERSGAYAMLVNALFETGVNKFHSHDVIVSAMKAIGSADDTKVEGKGGKVTTAWQRFANKAPKSKKAAKDIDGRILQNALVLQRLGGQHPYGFKLKQLGLSIHVAPLNQSPDCKEPKYMLSTETDKPTNMLSSRARKAGIEAPKPTKAPKAKAPKAKKPKARKPKAVKAETATEAPATSHAVPVESAQTA